MVDISGHFGRSIAGLILEDMINENKIPQRKQRLINTTIIDLHKGLNILKKSCEPDLYERFRELWVGDIEARAKALQLPTKVESHLLSTIKGIGRQHSRLFNIVHNRKKLGKKRIERLQEELKKHNKRFGIVFEVMK